MLIDYILNHYHAVHRDDLASLLPLAELADHIVLEKNVLFSRFEAAA